MPWIIAGASVLGAGLGSLGASSASRAQVKAQKKAIQAQERQYQQSLAMLEPTRYLGYQAQNDLASLYGYGMAPYMGYSNINDIGNRQGRNAGVRDAYAGFYAGQGTGGAAPGAAGGQAGAGNMSRFFTSPDYTFRRDEGIRGIEQGAAARGGALSGNALRAVTGFNSNLASGEFGAYINRLLNMAGMNQTATSGAIQAGQNATNAISQGQQNMGDARASGVLNSYGAGMNALNNGVNAWLYSRPSQYTMPADIQGYQYPFDTNTPNYNVGPRG